MSPWWTPKPDHVANLVAALEDIEAGRCKRLAVFMPPRHGKSALVSVLFPAWFLGRNPDKRIIHASYGTQLSETFSRQVRNLVRDDERYRAVFPGTCVSDDSQSVTRWDLSPPSRGGFQSVGVGSGVTGHGADMAIIDDPVKGHEAADSETQRESTWSWYTHDLLTRLHPGAALVLCATRWHEDDLPGRILAGSDAHRWRVITMPALTESNDALWPERYDVKALEEIREAVGSRAWEALYQQRPTALQGNLFQSEWFADEWLTLPSRIESVIVYCDPSVKEKAVNDEWAWTTGCVGRDNLLYIVNGCYGHYDTPSAEEKCVEIAHQCDARWPGLWRFVFEDSAAGAPLMQYLRRSHPEIPVTLVKVHQDKVARARGVEAFCEASRVRLPAGYFPWKEQLLSQLMSFPYAVHDDRVDSFVGLVTEAVRRWQPVSSVSGDVVAPSFRSGGE